jgi:hypothetical protein
VLFSEALAWLSARNGTWAVTPLAQGGFVVRVWVGAATSQLAIRELVDWAWALIDVVEAMDGDAVRDTDPEIGRQSRKP